jgi:hypothetical protein
MSAEVLVRCLPPSTRQAVLSVGAPDPVQRQHDLCGDVIDIGDCFVDEGSHNPLLQPRVGRRS